jgi:hypothetical protein
MVESRFVSKDSQKLSPQDRLWLITTLNALVPMQFEELLFALDPPSAYIPGNSAPQGNRSKALLDWAKAPGGPGLSAVEKLLRQVIAKRLFEKSG